MAEPFSSKLNDAQAEMLSGKGGRGDMGLAGGPPRPPNEEPPPVLEIAPIVVTTSGAPRSGGGGPNGGQEFDTSPIQNRSNLRPEQFTLNSISPILPLVPSGDNYPNLSGFPPPSVFGSVNGPLGVQVPCPDLKDILLQDERSLLPPGTSSPVLLPTSTNNSTTGGAAGRPISPLLNPDPISVFLVLDTDYAAFLAADEPETRLEAIRRRASALLGLDGTALSLKNLKRSSYVVSGDKHVMWERRGTRRV